MKLKKKILSVLLSVLFACSSITGGYLSITAVPVQAAEILEAPQIIAAILALLGVSAIAKNSGSDSTSAVRAGYTAEYEMFMKYAYGCEMYSDKSDAQIDAMIAGWCDDWKHGVAVIGDDAWSLFQSFASSRYKDNSVSGGDSSDSATKGQMLNFPANYYILRSAHNESFGYSTWYGYDCPYKAGLVTIGSKIYIMTIPQCAIGTTYRMAGGSRNGWLNTYYAFLDGFSFSIKDTDYDSGKTMEERTYNTKAVADFSEMEMDVCNIYSVGTFNNFADAYDYLGGITEEDLKKDNGEDLPANFGIPWLSDGVKDLYDRDTSLGNYDVLGRSGTIDTDGTVAGDRVISLPGVDTLDKVTTGEMSWADYMEKVGAIGIDKVDGITADTPVVKGDAKDGSKTETVKDIYVTAPSDGKDFVADLKELFPFCIPFDLIHALKILSADPETPYFEVPVKIHSFGIDVDYTFVLDFEQFNMIAKVLRTVETLGFIVLLIWVTRDLIKG